MNQERDLYQTLGVPPGATDQDIKAAYRRRAAEHHPDKGGDTEQFLAVQLAYDTLSDPGRRDRYDRTGRADVPRDRTSSDAVKLVMDAFAKLDHRRTDIVGRAATEAERRAGRCRDAAAKAREAAGEMEDAAGRFVPGEGEADLFGAALANEAAAARRGAVLNEEEAEHWVRVAELIHGHGYRVDPDPDGTGMDAAMERLARRLSGEY